MIRHKAIELLKKFSNHDIKLFRRFLNSPYFNRSKSVNQLFLQLIKYHPGFEDINFNKENIYLKLSKKKAYNDSTFRGLMFDLQQLLYKFISVEGLSEDKLYYKVNNIKLLITRGCKSLAKTEVRNIENSLEKHKADYDYFYNLYLLETYKYNIGCETLQINNKAHASGQFNVMSSSCRHLFVFYFMELVCEFINTVTFSAKYNIELNGSIPHLLLSMIDVKTVSRTFKSSNSLFFILDLYISLLKSYDNLGNISYIRSYKNKISKYESKLTRSELSFHFSNLINYFTIKQNNRKSIEINHELFEIYEHFLINEYYKNPQIDYLPTDLFRAILVNAITCRKHDWVENFINVYSQKLSEKDKLNMYNYGYSLYFISIGKPREALDYMDRINVNKFIFKYDMYNNKLKLYFEFENPQKALDHIHTYNEFLRKDNFFSETRKLQYRNFVKYVKAIINFREGKAEDDIDYIRNQIENTEFVINRAWLIEKISEIKDKKKITSIAQ